MTTYALHPALPPIKIKTHARAKHLKLKILANEIVLTIPPYTTQRHIQQFLHKQQDWLLQHWQKPVLISELQLYDYYQAQRHTVKIQLYDANSRFLYQYQAEQQQLLVNAQHAPHAIKQFILAYAKQHLPHILQDMAKRMNIQISKIAIRHAKSLWGSCSQHHAIMLNAFLICCPRHLIDYVCIHELAHTVHFNHSPDFWALVAQYDTHYQQHRAELKQISIFM